MSIVTIPLTKGYETVIDECDAWLAEFKWTVVIKKYGIYAYRQEWRDGKKKTLYLHGMILTAPPGMDIDHRDGDGLNNRRRNLRICTHQQNLMNRAPVSGYKGVRLMPTRQGVRGPGMRSKPWQARICSRNIGYFTTAEEAAAAYDRVAFAEFGEFAWLNRDHFREVA